MNLKLKELDQQVVVVTGATSGIGLATARKAAQSGAHVVLCARNADAVKRVTDELDPAGNRVHGVVGDVGRFEDVRRLGREAIDRFGRIDTWVNNAGVAIYGRLLEVPLEDHRRLFETNFWGVVHGSQVAVEHMRGAGGALVNIGSTLSDRAFPLQGMYSASKHAVQGYTDALRMELQHDHVPIAVSLLKPAAIATQYTEHARSYTGHEPRNAPPYYAPAIVADAILYCAQHPTRHLFVGGAAKAMSLLGKWAPRLADKTMERTMFRLQQGRTLRGGRDNLDGPAEDGKETGGRGRPVFQRSAYTAIARRPRRVAATLFGGLVLAGLLG